MSLSETMTNNTNTNKLYINFLINDNKLKYDNLKKKQLKEEKEAYVKSYTLLHICSINYILIYINNFLGQTKIF